MPVPCATTQKECTRSTVGRALRWLREQGWLNRDIRWRHGKRLVCRWLRLLRPAALPCGGQVTSGTPSDTSGPHREEEGTAHPAALAAGSRHRTQRSFASVEPPRRRPRYAAVAGQNGGLRPRHHPNTRDGAQRLIGSEPDEHAPPGRLVGARSSSAIRRLCCAQDPCLQRTAPWQCVVVVTNG